MRTFFSLIQADGYNPLEVSCSTFTVKKELKNRQRAFLEELIYDVNSRNKIIHLLDDKFTPGQLMNEIHKNEILLKLDEDEFLIKLLSLCEQNIEASCKEGFWSDHFTYNMDLIEDFLRIYPDKKYELLYKNSTCTFYDSPLRVLPRMEKYVLTDHGVRQFGAVEFDTEKCTNKDFHPAGTNWLKDCNGNIITVSLYVKILALASIKFATLDPGGMGVEMEAGKPGWNDAMNGLPGLIGSGMSETIELERIIRFLLQETDNIKEYFIPKEIFDLINKSISYIQQLNDKIITDFDYWDSITDTRENFREVIRFCMSGKEIQVSGNWLNQYLLAAHRKISEGIKNALLLGNGIMPTYFTYHAVKYEEYRDSLGNLCTGYHGFPTVKVKSFELVLLPIFLEGPAKYFNIVSDKEQAITLYQLVKNSDLYDKKLKMYKTSIPLDYTSMELGRIRSFTPGWLERESIFLHMEYKYLLGLLKSELYETFFKEAKNTLIPFLNPNVYGRSTIENSSFLASSNNPDPSTHGRGFVARLSGSTTEVLSMWIYMMTGDKPFNYVDCKLTFSLNPILPGWFFDKNGEVKFQLCSKTMIIYRNPKHKNTYGPYGVSVREMIISGVSYGRNLIGEMANRVRKGEIKEIECILG